MAAYHTKFIRSAVPEKLEKMDNGKIKVTWKSGSEQKSDEYDTVLFAMGRYAVTEGLNLSNAGVNVEKGGKFIVNDFEQTNVPHIYAIGDV